MQHIKYPNRTATQVENTGFHGSFYSTYLETTGQAEIWTFQWFFKCEFVSFGIKIGLKHIKNYKTVHTYI